MTDGPPVTPRKLWISAAATPYGGEYGLVAVVAATREEAIAKAGAKLELTAMNYVPHQRYAQALLDGLIGIREVSDEVFIDWTAAEPRR
jgi:hypothetical protein